MSLVLATMIAISGALLLRWATPGDASHALALLEDASAPACVAVSTEARFVGHAYNHIVHIANGCSAAKSCAVATDVNPEPQLVSVPAGARAEVLTFRGSPARTFTAAVRCAP